VSHSAFCVLVQWFLRALATVQFMCSTTGKLRSLLFINLQALQLDNLRSTMQLKRFATRGNLRVLLLQFTGKFACFAPGKTSADTEFLRALLQGYLVSVFAR